MTQRERHTPDNGTSPLARPPADRPASPCPAACSAQAGEGASLWADWYHRAEPAQRQQVLALAAQQGVVYAHQLPPVEAATSAPRPPRRPLLPSLLSGPLDLEPLRAPDLEPFDADLDGPQRQAVSQAAHTPDVCLIQGYPGTGKSRVVAEVVRQAAARGERVLLVAPAGAALDRVLLRLESSPGLCPVRCLGPDEALDSLPPEVRRLTPAERCRCFEEHTLPAAGEEVRAAEALCAARQADEGAWARFEELVDRLSEFDAEGRALEADRPGLAARVQGELTAPPEGGEPSELQGRWAECQRSRDEALARADARLAEVRAEAEKLAGEQAQLEAERDQLQPLAEAKQGQRWWTGAWWRATVQGNLLVRLDEVRQRCQELAGAQERLRQQAETLTRDRAEAEARCEQARAELLAEEVEGRQAKLDAQADALTWSGRQLEANWQALAARLSEGVRPPTTMSAESVQEARAAWAAQLRRDRERAELARQWAVAVEQARPALAQGLLSCANLVAVTLAGLAGDRHFSERSSQQAGFDLLIVEEAHQVTESEFLAASRRGRRWVLVGEPAAEAEEPPAPRQTERARWGGRPARVTVPRPGLFQRIWRNLHTDPRRLPAGWFLRDGRLVCRLRPVPPEQEPWVEREHVADRPEIELRIVAPPRGRRQPGEGGEPRERGDGPQLAEVIFPGSFSVPEAKEYIYRELEELTVQARGPGVRWVEGPGRLALELSDSAVRAGAVAVALGNGVSEVVGPWVPPASGPPPAAPQSGGGEGREQAAGWQTYALEFDRDAGWDRERAEQWVEERLHLRDLGRTTLLALPYRPQPPLARFLSDLLFAGACQPWPCGDRRECGGGLEVGGDGWAPVEFVVVPSLSRAEAPRATEPEPRWGAGGTATAACRHSAVAPRVRAARGAGLEIDLADQRRPERMPADVRSALPPDGLVNYLEALAVVQALEGLVADKDFQVASDDWQRRSLGCPTVAVMALFPAQVDLLRLLISRSRGLSESCVPAEAGLPSAFHQRECLVAFLSLTRSHTDRAVPYADSPATLMQALTRPAERLVLFGDLGTLARRSQWQGALDHLDESAGRREQAVVTHLLGYAQGHGAHPKAFRLQESGSV
jgi:hypothetical protein